MSKPISRRQLLQWSGLSGAGLLLSSCGSNFGTQEIGQVIEPLNQATQSLLLSQKPVPEFSIHQVEPDKLLINTFDQTPKIDPAQYRLEISGEVNHPMQLSLANFRSLPFTSMVIQHVCVEGWAAIVQWGGVRLQDLLKLAQPKLNARYVYFKSADGYYESWDFASAMHPQTLMAYQHNGKLLSVEHGAPLRLASPVKLGYKQSKWVTQIILTAQLMPQKGYWEDQGYEWFGGL